MREQEMPLGPEILILKLHRFWGEKLYPLQF